MTLIERIRRRLLIWWLLATMPRIAGADDDPPPAEADPPINEGNPPPRTFTQEDVDRIVQARLKQAEPKYAELREKAEKFDRLEDENRSELEKAQEVARTAAEERDAAVSSANQALVRAAVVAEAAKQGAVDADAVFALLPKDSVTVDDGGQVTGAEEAVKALLDTKKYLAGETPAGPGDGGARTPVQPKDLQEQIREAEAKGDVNTSISLKSQQLAQLSRQA